MTECCFSLVIGTIDSTVLECIDVLRDSMLSSSSVLKDISKEDLLKGMEVLKQRFSRKMEPISCKLEVSEL